MEIAVLIVTFAGVVVTGVAAVAAVVQARAATAAKVAAEDARNESRIARDEAARLSAEANAAFLRQAEAQERANELAEAAIPTKDVHWALGEVKKGKWLVTNNGSLGATTAVLRSAAGGKDGIRPDETEPRDVVVGDSLGFIMWRGSGMLPPRLVIEWTNPLTQEHHSTEVAVPH